jgi:hypothetical protein
VSHREKELLRPSLAERFRQLRAVFFVGLGLVATVTWIAFMVWLLYRAVLGFGFV